jgi:endonuclease-3
VDRLAPLYGMPEWRPHGDPVSELVLTILSQNTNDNNSGRAFMRLRARFPSWAALANASEEDIEREIAVGGLARQKAPRIKSALNAIIAERGSLELGFLGEMPLGDAKAWLQSLDGVGPKTAACVLVFALGRPALPVDTHVHRVAQRLGLVPGKATAAQAHGILEGLIDEGTAFAFHVLLIKHGRRLCTARAPRCPDCPLRDRCPAAATFYR